MDVLYSSSGNEIDEWLSNSVPRNRNKLKENSSVQLSSEDEFEREMNEELNAKITSHIPKPYMKRIKTKEEQGVMNFSFINASDF